MGHRRAAAGHAARPRRASEDARLDAGLGRRRWTRRSFRTRRSIVKGNLVGVVAPTEWEAISAAQQVAADTKWTDWKGLPGHAQLHTWLREEADWKTTPVAKGDEEPGRRRAGARRRPRRRSRATYELPFMKHAPIGPTIAVGDARPDGTVFVHTHNQNPQALRGQIAMMLGTPVDNVVVRIYAGPGHYGRSNGGNAGAEDEAVILSKAVGQPVRVQWMRPDDLQWSTQSPAGVLRHPDRTGTRAARSPRTRPITTCRRCRTTGSSARVLAGLPTPPAPDVNADAGSISSTVNAISGSVALRPGAERRRDRATARSSSDRRHRRSAIGLRDHSMRTPGQLQQNFPRELAISEAAALAGVDAIEFRLEADRRRAADRRAEGGARGSGWETRPSPAPKRGGDGRRRRSRARASR